MREIPLLCTDAVVRAYLDGRKTQTRRPIKWALNECGEPAAHLCQIGTSGRWIAWWGPANHDACQQITDRTYQPKDGLPGLCQSGDRVWIRECWRLSDTSRDCACYEPCHCRSGVPMYRANSECPDEDGPWKPSIHMPRWATRIVLPVVAVRAERVRDITEHDTQAEGVGHRDAYLSLWRTLYGTKYPPETAWCWVIETEPYQGARHGTL